MWLHRLVPVLLLLLLGSQQGLAALEPIGAAAACSEGHVYRMSCFIDSAGYIADVQYSTTVRNTPVSLCNANDWQLQAAKRESFELSPSDYFVSFKACSSTSGGLRGLAFLTSLGAELTCGSLTGSSCRNFSSRSTYPLRGMQAACQTHTTAGQARGDAELDMATRVSSITAACWVPRRQARPQECLPGQGVRGGGLPCQLCPVSQYSPGGSPCKPCPAGTTTLGAGQSKCGCFPGEGVYGPVKQSPDVCEECPGGTYSQGGALAPCQPCSPNAFDYLTSAPGSRSIADCVCAAGYGTTPHAPTTCSICRDGYFGEGPLPRAQPAAAATDALATSFTAQAPPPAPVPAQTTVWPDWLPQTLVHHEQLDSHAATNHTANRHVTLLGATSHGKAALHPESVWTAAAQSKQRTLQQVNSVFSTPTYNPCTFCGPGCSTRRPGATSPQDCRCFIIPAVSPAPTPPSSPSPSPSPIPSPSPSPSPGVSPSPSPPVPSPSPAPSPPPPSPNPGSPQCINCDTNLLQQYMSIICPVNSMTQTFAILSNVGPCYVAVQAGNWLPQGVVSSPNIFLAGSFTVDCSLVRQQAGPASVMFTGVAPSSSCTMPSSYEFVIPAVSTSSSEGDPPSSNTDDTPSSNMDDTEPSW